MFPKLMKLPDVPDRSILSNSELGGVLRRGLIEDVSLPYLSLSYVPAASVNSHWHQASAG